MRYYAGIGSRKAPKSILSWCKLLAKELAREGYTLRTGGAEGCDTAFLEGAFAVDPSLVELYLPWPGFTSNLRSGCKVFKNPKHGAFEIAGRVWKHRGRDNWDSVKKSVKSLMARNVHQILGKSLDLPVKFVICWTPEGKDVGGTAQALALARIHDIPIFNIACEQDLNDLITKLI